MKKILSLLSHPLVLILLFAGPVIMKWALTGRLGVDFQFYFIFGWLPVLSLLYGLRFGIKMVVATLLIYGVAAVLIYFNYPENPMLDFKRQILLDGTPVYAIAFGMSFLGQIAFRMAKQA